MNIRTLGYRALHGMLWGFIGKFLEFALAFVFSIFVARSLGPDIYGRYNVFISMAATFVLFSSFGFDSILNKFIPQLKEKGGIAVARSFFYRLLCIEFLILFTSGIIIWTNSGFLSNFFSVQAIHQYSILFVIIFINTGIQNLTTSFFNALLRLKTITFVRTVVQLSALVILIIFFAYFGQSLKVILQVAVFYTGMSIAILLFLSLRLSTQYDVRYSYDYKSYLRFGFSVWQLEILTYTISATLGILLMEKILKDPVQVGFYSTAILFAYLPGTLINSWAKVILPVMSEAKIRHGVSGLAEAFVSFSKVIFILLIPTLLFLGRYADVLVLNLFGQKFAPSIILVEAYVFFNFIAIMGAPHIGINTLYALDKTRVAFVIRLIAGALNIALIFLLAIPYKALGIMIAGCIAITFQTFGEFFAVRKHIPIKYPFIYLFKITICAALGLLMLAWIPILDLAAVIIAGALYAVILFIFFHYIRLLTDEDKEFLSRIHPNVAVVVKYF